ncbi:hypothetical protein Tco_1183170 [Tanacetum coccineum]
MELVLEHTQQGTSNEVSDTSSDTESTHNEDGNFSGANIYKAVEILLKMNLPDHRSVLTDSEGQVKMEMEIPRSSGVNSQPHAHT